MESCLGFMGLDQEFWKSLHQDSIWRIPGVHQDSLMVHNGCYLMRGPDQLQEAWHSVRPSSFLKVLLFPSGSFYSMGNETEVNCFLWEYFKTLFV